MLEIPPGQYSYGYGDYMPVRNHEERGKIEEFKCLNELFGCKRIMVINHSMSVMPDCFRIEDINSYIQINKVKINASGIHKQVYLFNNKGGDICWDHDFADSFCKSLGMRLPTRDEVEFFHDYNVINKCLYDNPGGKVIYLPEYTDDIYYYKGRQSILFDYSRETPVPVHINPQDCTQIPFRCVKEGK